MKRTRIKICGLTRLEDVELALELGADALGFVLWPGSPRHVMVEELKHLTAHLPAFAKSVGLVVTGQHETIKALLSEVPLDLLQFHGDESAAECEGYGINYLRAARMSAGLDLIEFEKSYPGARALLLDAHTPSYGGSGKVFDWSLIPAELAPRVVLSGGLNAQNVAEAIQRVRPYAVDVSSGVEAAPGIKDKERMRHFFLEVARADQTI